jgi:hypothetical protein
MITGAVCFVAGLFFDHFYPVPAQLVRDQVARGLAAARAFFTKGNP